MSLVGRMGKAFGNIIGISIVCGGLIWLILWRDENNFRPVLLLLGLGGFAIIRELYRVFSGHGREVTAKSRNVIGEPIPMFWYLGRTGDSAKPASAGPVWCALVVSPPTVRVHGADRELAAGQSDNPWADLGPLVDAWPISGMEQVRIVSTDVESARRRESEAKRQDALLNWTVGKLTRRSMTTLMVEAVVAITFRDVDGVRHQIAFGVPQRPPPGISVASLMGVVLPENWVGHTWDGLEVVTELAETAEAFATPERAGGLEVAPRFATNAAKHAAHTLLSRIASAG
jgi:hypothetical protein